MDLESRDLNLTLHIDIHQYVIYNNTCKMVAGTFASRFGNICNSFGNRASWQRMAEANGRCGQYRSMLDNSVQC